MTNIDWQPDIRQVFEPGLCRLRTVYQATIARKNYLCDQCYEVIHKGEQHDAVAIQGSGVNGYINPLRLHRGCREAYITRRNERYAEQHGIILSICMICGKYCGYKDGQGVTGLSGGPCEDCEEAWISGVK